MSAVFSACGTYRLRLDRELDTLGGATIGFCLHNPSRAGTVENDPTTRRGIGFAGMWRASRLVFVNPWAGIATKPRDLWSMRDPVGPENDRHIVEAARECRESGGFMVAAWGAILPPARAAATARLAHVEALIRGTGCELRALGVNRDGSPKHPLYVPGNASPLAWPERWRSAA